MKKVFMAMVIVTLSLMCNISTVKDFYDDPDVTFSDTGFSVHGMDTWIKYETDIIEYMYH